MSERYGDLEFEALRDELDSLIVDADKLMDATEQLKKLQRDLDAAIREQVELRKDKETLTCHLESLRVQRDAALFYRDAAVRENAELEKENASLQSTVDALKMSLIIANGIGDTFWAALKRLNLKAINVTNPGQHVTDVIDERDALRKENEKLKRWLILPDCKQCRGTGDVVNSEEGGMIMLCDCHAVRIKELRDANDTLARQVDTLRKQLDDWHSKFMVACEERDAAVASRVIIESDLARQVDELKAELTKANSIAGERGVERLRAVSKRDAALQEVEKLKMRNVVNGLAYGQMEEEVARLKVAVKKAAVMFRCYEVIHRSKNTTAGDEKAEANGGMAMLMERALASTPQAL